jgi:hypothetical protein
MPGVYGIVEEIGEEDESPAVVLPNYYGGEPTLTDSQAASLSASDEQMASDNDTGKGKAGKKARKAEEPVPSSAQFLVELLADDMDDAVLAELCQIDLHTAAMQALQRELRNAFGLTHVTGELELVSIEDAGSSGDIKKTLKATLKATGTDIVSVLLVHSRKASSNAPLMCTLELSGGDVSLAILLGKVQRLA